MKDWKQRLDELELQLALGVMEGREAYERQKEKMKSYVEEASRQLADMKGLSEELKTQMRGRLEEAQLQFALGRAEGKAAYEEQKARIDAVLNELQDIAKNARTQGDDALKNWSRELAGTIQTFRIQLEISRVYFALGKAEANAKTEAYRAEMKQKIQELRTRFEAWADLSEDKWDDFTEELKTSVGHFGKAFQKLFS